MQVKKFKVNELTKQPGGYFLAIKFTDGFIEKTVNTKSPYYYVSKVIKENANGGRTVESVITKSGEIVYSNGEFTPKFLTRDNKAIF